MLEYDTIDISQGTVINKTNASKECDIYLYWYFLDKNFKYEPYLCNGSHDLMQKVLNFSNAAIVSVKRSDYRINFWYMSKNDAINTMKSSNLNEKSGSLYFFLLYLKMSDTTYYQRSRDIILNIPKDYYKNDKKRLRDTARDKYRNLSEEEKK